MVRRLIPGPDEQTDVPAKARPPQADQEPAELVEVVILDRAKDQVQRFGEIRIETRQINTPCPT